MRMSERRRKGRYYCGHCEEKISKTLNFKHKRLYYNPDSEEWTLSKDVQENYETIADFVFSSDSDAEAGMILPVG